MVIYLLQIWMFHRPLRMVHRSSLLLYLVFLLPFVFDARLLSLLLIAHEIYMRLALTSYTIRFAVSKGQQKSHQPKCCWCNGIFPLASTRKSVRRRNLYMWPISLESSHYLNYNIFIIAALLCQFFASIICLMNMWLMCMRFFIFNSVAVASLDWLQFWVWFERVEYGGIIENAHVSSKFYE